MTRITRSSGTPTRPATRGSAGPAQRAGRGEAAAPVAAPGRSAAADPNPQQQQQPRQPRSRAPLPAQPAIKLPDGDRPAAILFLVEELTTQLTQENLALENRAFDDLREALPRKQALTRAYTEMVLGLKKDPDQVKGLEPERRNALLAAGEKLDETMQRNELLLRANINAINSFMGSITSALRDAQEAQSASYSDHGKMDSKNITARALAVALNKEL